MKTLEHKRELLSVAEVAARLGVSEPTVRRKIAEGELPALRLGGPGTTIRVPRDDLNSWLDRHAIENEAA